MTLIGGPSRNPDVGQQESLPTEVGTMPCTIPYHTITCHTIPYHTMPCHAMPYYNTIPSHPTIPYHTTMPCHTIPYPNMHHTIP